MQYKTILNNISEGIMVVDPQLRIKFLNSAAERITNFSNRYATGKACSEIFHTPLCESACPLKSALENSKDISDYETFITRTDGSEMPIRVSASIMRDQDGNISGVVGNFRDITEIRSLMWEVVEKHTMALEEKTKLETILDSIAEGVFTIDTDWRISSFNAAAERITGFAAEEAIGKTCFDIFRSDMCGSNCAVAQSLETGKPIFNYEVNITSKDGRKIPIGVSSAVITNDDGQVIGAVENFRDLSEIKRLTAEVMDKYEFANIIGKSKNMQDIYQVIQNLSDADATVLIQGESGTGKELVAKAIHYNSQRRDKPFITVSCAALTESILESELFGHEKGAFTGAIMNKAGRFEIADGGTLFLDEIGEISSNIQVKLLRVLESQEFERVGGTETIKVSIRVIAATNRDLDSAMQEGNFRQDLFYRLNVIPIHTPPLREKSEDIPLLAGHFIKLFRQKTGKNIPAISPGAMDLILDYKWPGNVRELENAIEHAFVHCQSGMILPNHLPENLSKSRLPVAEIALLSENPLDEAERQVILRALEKANWDRSKVMDQLKLSRTTLWRKMHKYGLND